MSTLAKTQEAWEINYAKEVSGYSAIAPRQGAARSAWGYETIPTKPGQDLPPQTPCR